MIRPAGEIEFPPSEFLRMKAAMLVRMETLNQSTESLLGVIARRIGAQDKEDIHLVEELTTEQERLINNMRKLARAS